MTRPSFCNQLPNRNYLGYTCDLTSCEEFSRGVRAYWNKRYHRITGRTRSRALPLPLGLSLGVGAFDFLVFSVGTVRFCFTSLYHSHCHLHLSRTFQNCLGEAVTESRVASLSLSRQRYTFQWKRPVSFRGFPSRFLAVRYSETCGHTHSLGSN